MFVEIETDSGVSYNVFVTPFGNIKIISDSQVPENVAMFLVNNKYCHRYDCIVATNYKKKSGRRIDIGSDW